MWYEIRKKNKRISIKLDPKKNKKLKSEYYVGNNNLKKTFGLI